MTKLINTYQAERVVQYLHLQAEVEMLLQQLKNLKQQQSQCTVYEPTKK